jgi:hypothetical protein
MRIAALMFGLLVVAVGAAALPIDDGDAPGDDRAATRGNERASGDREEPAATPTPRDDRATPSDDDVPRAHCPGGVTGCRSVRGSVLYVERVDPDGDGDLHVVVVGGSVTAPGLTAVDVRADLRPRRDPRVGDRVSAAGPVQRGSYGQSQIHALEFHASRG